jgi:hypothetical protein
VVAARELPVAWAFGALAVLGVGLGPASSTALVAPQSAAPWHLRGLVTSAIYAMRMLGGALAVAAFGGHVTEQAARFEGLAVVSLAAACVLSLLAPSETSALGESAFDVVAAPGE